MPPTDNFTHRYFRVKLYNLSADILDPAGQRRLQIHQSQTIRREKNLGTNSDHKFRNLLHDTLSFKCAQSYMAALLVFDALADVMKRLWTDD